MHDNRDLRLLPYYSTPITGSASITKPSVPAPWQKHVVPRHRNSFHEHLGLTQLVPIHTLVKRDNELYFIFTGETLSQARFPSEEGN